MSRQMARNGRSDTPASGARKKRPEKVCGPMCIGSPPSTKGAPPHGGHARRGRDRARGPDDARGRHRRPAPRRRGARATSRMVYAADLAGWLEPCGCSANQRGGLARAATAIARIRAENPDTSSWPAATCSSGGPSTRSGERQELSARPGPWPRRSARWGSPPPCPGSGTSWPASPSLEATGLPFTRSKQGSARSGSAGSARFRRLPFRVAVVHEGGSRAGGGPGRRGAERGGRPRARRPPGGAARRRRQPGRPRRAGAGGAGPGAGPVARPDRRLPPGDRSKGFAILPGPSAAGRGARPARRAARRVRPAPGRAQAAGNDALAAALAGKIDRARGARAGAAGHAAPVPPTDRPSMQMSFVPLSDDVPEDQAVRRILTRHYGAVARRTWPRRRPAGAVPRRRERRPLLRRRGRGSPRRHPRLPQLPPGRVRVLGEDPPRRRLRDAREGEPAVRPRLRLLPRHRLEAARGPVRRGLHRGAAAACSARPATGRRASTPSIRRATSCATRPRPPAPPVTHRTTAPASSPPASARGCSGPGTGGQGRPRPAPDLPGRADSG